MTNGIHDVGVARQIGAYSDAVEVPPGARWLVTAGTPGLALDGTLPKDITGQAEQAWTHIIAMLTSAGMDVNDLVKVTHYLQGFGHTGLCEGPVAFSRRGPSGIDAAGGS